MEILESKDDKIRKQCTGEKNCKPKDEPTNTQRSSKHEPESNRRRQSQRNKRIANLSIDKKRNQNPKYQSETNLQGPESGQYSNTVHLMS